MTRYLARQRSEESCFFSCWKHCFFPMISHWFTIVNNMTTILNLFVISNCGLNLVNFMVWPWFYVMWNVHLQQTWVICGLRVMTNPSVISVWFLRKYECSRKIVDADAVHIKIMCCICFAKENFSKYVLRGNERKLMVWKVICSNIGYCYQDNSHSIFVTFFYTMQKSFRHACFIGENVCPCFILAFRTFCKHFYGSAFTAA